MSKKTLGFTVALAWLVGSIGQAGELSQDQLDEVAAFAQAQDYYNCNNFKDAYRHPSMNQVYAVDAHSIYRVACVQAASGTETVWFQRSDQGPLKPIWFATPQETSPSGRIGFRRFAKLMNAVFDPETNETSNHFEWTENNSKSEGGIWKFVDGKFVLQTYYIDARDSPLRIYDGEISSAAAQRDNRTGGSPCAEIEGRPFSADNYSFLPRGRPYNPDSNAFTLEAKPFNDICE